MYNNNFIRKKLEYMYIYINYLPIPNWLQFTFKVKVKYLNNFTLFYVRIIINKVGIRSKSCITYTITVKYFIVLDLNFITT
jgi:hypothetical protein